MKFDKKSQSNAMNAARLVFFLYHPAAKHLIAQPFFGVVGEVDGVPVVVVKFTAMMESEKIWAASAFYRVAQNSITSLEEWQE